MLQLRLVVSRASAALKKSAGQQLYKSMSSSSENASIASITARSGVNPEIFTKRQVVIYRPARCAMTQGRAEHHRPWKLM
jgi:hypothetical protein